MSPTLIGMAVRAALDRIVSVVMMMDQRIWVRWLEVAIEHEAEAKRRFAKLLEGVTAPNLVPEYRAALVSVTAAAFAVEAMYKELKLVMPGEGRNRPTRVAASLRNALDLPEREYQDLLQAVRWLFELRNDAVHPFSELQPVTIHPANLTTGVECCTYNAVSSQRAVDLAVEVISKFADPDRIANAAVREWGIRQSPYINGPLKDALDGRATRLVQLRDHLWIFEVS